VTRGRQAIAADRLLPFPASFLTLSRALLIALGGQVAGRPGKGGAP
jgi:hypothetical protein